MNNKNAKPVVGANLGFRKHWDACSSSERAALVAGEGAVLARARKFNADRRKVNGYHDDFTPEVCLSNANLHAEIKAGRIRCRNSEVDRVGSMKGKLYQITRVTREAVWVRWEAFGSSAPRGCSRKIPIEIFRRDWERLPQKKARKKVQKKG